MTIIDWYIITTSFYIAEALIDAKDVCLPKLSILDCNMRLRGHGIKELSCKGFPIKQLDLTLLADVTSQHLGDVLRNLENTLKVLKLKFHPRCAAANEPSIPPLKNLTNLSLNGYRNSLKFLEILPNLRSLTLIRLHFSRALAAENIVLKFISKLECLEIHEDLTKNCKITTVNILLSLFPSIKRLKLENLTDDAVSGIFGGYLNLEEFDGLNGLYSDESITGLTCQDLTTIKNSMEEMSSNNCPRARPSIANLKGHKLKLINLNLT